MAYGALNSLLSANRPVQGNLAEALAHFMPMGGGQLGGQSGGQFPAPPPPGGFAPAPSYSGSSFLDPENAMPIAAALMKGPSFGDALGNAFSAYGETSQRRKSRDYLAKNFPELATFAEAGAPEDILWRSAMKQRGLGGGDVSYSAPTLMSGPNGDEYVMFGNDGSIKRLDGQGLAPKGKITYRDQGTYTGVFQDGAEIAQLPKDVFGKGYQEAAGKAAGQYAGEAPERKTKALSTLDALDNQRVIVDDDIKRSITIVQNSPNLTTGIVGGLAKAVPGTDAYKLKQRLETIKANIGFDKLQTMRENSPTGGALGQVSDFENRQLQAVFGSLDQANDPQEILYNLERLQLILANSKEARRRAFARDFGEEAPPESISPPAGNPSPRLRYNPETGELE